LEESGERVRGVFQGGEVVYAKVFDEEGREMRNEGRGGLVAKKRGDSKRQYGGGANEADAERCKRYFPY